MHRIDRHAGCVSSVVTTATSTCCCCIVSRVILTKCRYETRCIVATCTIGSGRVCKHGGGRRHSNRIQSIVAGHTGYGDTIGGELPQYAVAEDAAHVETGGVMAEVTGR